MMMPGSILRLGTINPAPLLVRLQEAKIEYTFADPLTEGDSDPTVTIQRIFD